MFGLFSKNEKGLVVHDKIWLSELAKFKALLILKHQNPAVIFVAWFDETKHNLELFFKDNHLEEEVFLAERLSLRHQDKELVFVEHHPLRAEEQRIANQHSTKEMTVYSSISEPIFQLFGGGKIVDLMNKIGMKDEEMIEHDMISKSILRAQDKIAEKTTQSVAAQSQGEWLQNAGHQLPL